MVVVAAAIVWRCHRECISAIGVYGHKRFAAAEKSVTNILVPMCWPSTVSPIPPAAILFCRATKAALEAGEC